MKSTKTVECSIPDAFDVKYLATLFLCAAQVTEVVKS